MRRSAAWHARIACGPEVGAGFLVTARRVLTCAHVVEGSDRAAVTVSFPHARELGEVPAQQLGLRFVGHAPTAAGRRALGEGGSEVTVPSLEPLLEAIAAL
ncbi:hypothetical protein ACF073_13700 [Streptomyces sp. NPDC015171]|uniref:hypothetical protein n=1 Tax=Streptomyces sp. NPDC015171 TaxID=3364945 RepID=UPI0036FA860B